MNYRIDNENQVVICDSPKRPKKLTATRFANIFGLNVWNTPFATWCEITKTYEEAFTESEYTLAGKIVEEKVINYLNKRYFMDLKTPTDVYGPDYFNKTFGDFFKDQKVLGGMWDALGKDFIVEIKTTKRAEDWETDTPIYYKLQAALYAWLKGFDKFIVTCTFLEAKDYPILLNDGTWDTTPTNKFVPSIDNTIIRVYSLEEEFPDFENTFVKPALAWWEEHIVKGISPKFDEKKDETILNSLRKNSLVITDSDDINQLLAEEEKLAMEIEEHNKQIEDKVKTYELIKSKISSHMQNQFRDTDKKVEIKTEKRTYTVTKSSRKTVDSDKLKEDGLYDSYLKTSTSYTLKITDNK